MSDQALSAEPRPDFCVTVFDDVQANSLHLRGTTWPALAERLCDPPERPSKEDCYLIKLAKFGGKRTQHGSLRSNGNMVEVYGIEADYDAGIVAIEEAAETLRHAGVEAVLYTTPSHKADAPRWRVLVPLSHAYRPEERRRFVGVLNALLGGILAPESFTDSQAYYWGRVSGRPFIALRTPGIAIDLLASPPEPQFPNAKPKHSAEPTHDAEARGALGPDDLGLDDFAQVERHAAIARVDDATLEELGDAMTAIPADDRDTWIRMGQALASLKGTRWARHARQLWIEWSATSPKHDAQKDPAVWDNMTGSRSDFRAVFAEAQRSGWINERHRAPPGAAARSRRIKADAVAGDGVILTSGEVLEPESVTWLWRDWIAKKKLQILAGPPGMAKTTIALAFAATVSVGGRWPDGSPCAQGHVLIWTGEDGIEDTLLPRLIAMGADRSRIHFVMGRREDGKEVAFDPATDMPLLMAAAEQIPDVALMILDPVVSAVAGDSHKNTEVRRALQPVVDMAAAAGMGVLGITHFSKGSQKNDPVERVTGSIAFGAVARVVLAAQKVKSIDGDAGRFALVRAKSNLGPGGGGFAYSVDRAPLPGYENIQASRIVWAEALEGDARDLLAGPDMDAVEEQQERDEGERLMRELLNQGEVLSSSVKAAMKTEGYSDKQIRRIRKLLGVTSRRKGFGEAMKSYWAMPAHNAAPGVSSGAHSSHSRPASQAGTNGTNGHQTASAEFADLLDDDEGLEGD